MPVVPVNYLAVLVAAIANMVLGSLWFGPVFGKLWMKYSGINPGSITPEQKKGMWKSYAIMFVGSLVMAYVLAHSLVFANTYLNVSGWMTGLQAGFWNWLGFVAPVTIGVVLWDRKSWGHWAVTYLYYLVGLMMMGVILAMWG
ncbi:MAG: DUF1761 domain-containing protein [Patescibacteria group bacterium]